MILWLDAQLPPAIVPWLVDTLGLDARAVRDIGLRDATDRAIFDAAREQQAVVMTKDRDFVDLLQRHGPPPKVIWLTCGNTSNSRLRDILMVLLPQALALVDAGEPLIEISGE